MRGELKKRYGEKAQMQLITATRGLFGRRQPGAFLASALPDRIAASAVSGLAEVAEEKALWGRYGL